MLKCESQTSIHRKGAKGAEIRKEGRNMTDYRQKTIILPVSGMEAVIREGTGLAERILFSRKEKIHQALPDYWAHLTVSLGGTKPTRDDILDLLVPDQHALAIEIFRLNYGDVVALQSTCQACGKPSGYEVELDKLECIPLPADSGPPDPTFTVILARTGRRVTFGYLRGRDELEESDTEGIDLNRSDHRAIRSMDGKERVSYEDVVALPLADHRALRRARREKRCGYDTLIEFRCPKCGAAAQQELLLDPSFLLPGLVG